jgi:hypothetical protein
MGVIAMEVYKVYVHTEEDPHVSEMVVAATSKKEAESRALAHVKKSNPYKGHRAPGVSQDLSKVLYVKRAGTNGCLVIHRVPLEVFKRVKGVG